MQGTTQTAASRLAAFARAHREFSFYQVEGNHYAWKPAPGSDHDGELTHGRTEEELLAKLDGPGG